MQHSPADASRQSDMTTAQVRFFRAVDRLIAAAEDARTERERVMALIGSNPSRPSSEARR